MVECPAADTPLSALFPGRRTETDGYDSRGPEINHKTTLQRRPFLALPATQTRVGIGTADGDGGPKVSEFFVI